MIYFWTAMEIENRIDLFSVSSNFFFELSGLSDSCEQYNFDIIHKKGSENVIRITCLVSPLDPPTLCPLWTDVFSVSSIFFSELSGLSESCEQIIALKNVIYESKWPRLLCIFHTLRGSRWPSG